MLPSEDWNEASKPAIIPLPGTELGVLAGAMRQEEAMKGTQTRRKKGLNLPLCRWRGWLPTSKSPKFYQKSKKPCRISEFSRVSGYNIDIQESVVFLNTGNEHMEAEIKNTAPFKMASPR